MFFKFYEHHAASTSDTVPHNGVRIISDSKGIIFYLKAQIHYIQIIRVFQRKATFSNAKGRQQEH